MHVQVKFVFPLFTTTSALLVAILASTGTVNATLPETVKWTGGNFEWPCSTTRNMFKSSGKYISKNVIATRLAMFEDKAIVALPRYKAGIPATLAQISHNSESCEATLVPYPCWSLQEEGTCTALQNVVDIYLDPQNILWVLDTGVVNTLDEPVRKCPPKVLAINVVTGKLVKTVDLTGLTTSTSRLQYLVSDYSRQDGRVFIYVSDAASRAILVYDVTLGRGHRVVLPQAVATGTTRRDVLYIALLRRSDGSTCLIFTYLSSSRMFSIRTEHLRNGSAHGRIHDLGAKPKKMVLLGTDNGSALFFRYEGESDVYRWDATNPFVSRCFDQVYTSADCSLATHVVADYARARMRVLESSFPDYMQGSVGCGATQALTVM